MNVKKSSTKLNLLKTHIIYSKRCFGWFSRASARSNSIGSYQKCHLVISFSSCELGKSLISELASKDDSKIIAVSKDADQFKDEYKDKNVDVFESDLVYPEERSNLINWLHESKFGLKSIFHNYPRILKLEGEQRTVDHFKDIMGEIIEQPLNFNSDILNEELIHPGWAIYHSHLKQKGLFKVVHGSFLHMQRWLQEKLDQKLAKLVRVDPGIYSQKHIDNLGLDEDEKLAYEKAIIDPMIISKIIVDAILNENEISREIKAYDRLESNAYKELLGSERIPTEPESYFTII